MKRLMVCAAALLLHGTLLQAETLNLRIFTFSGAGIQLYYPDTISGSDRYIWHASAGIGLQVVHALALEGEFRFGGIIYADRGYSRLMGGNMGVRVQYMPERGRWTDFLYFRGGMSFEHFDRMRNDMMFLGVYMAPGLGLSLGSSKRFFLDNELFFQKTFPDIDGAMGHWRIGIRGALRLVL